VTVKGNHPTLKYLVYPISSTVPYSLSHNVRNMFLGTRMVF